MVHLDALGVGLRCGRQLAMITAQARLRSVIQQMIVTMLAMCGVMACVSDALARAIFLD